MLRLVDMESKFCSVGGVDSVLEGPAGLTLLNLQCFGGVWHFWRALTVFWRALTVFWRALTVFWRDAGRGVLEEALAVVLEGVAFLEKPLALFWRGCLQCEGCGILKKPFCSVLEGG